MAKFITNWEKTRKKGRGNYAFIRGSILATVISLILKRNEIWSFLNGETGALKDLYTTYFYILIGASVLYYFLIWWWRERLYKQEKL